MFASKYSDKDVGIMVQGFDAKRPAAVDQLKELLYAHKIVVLKDQTLSEQQFCEFSQRLGEPVPYLQQNYHHPQYPLIFVSSNVQKEGQQIGVARTGGYWHSDTSFMEQPVPLTLLYPQIIPKHSRRTTLFIDMQKAFDAMPQEMRRKLVSRRFIHSGKWRYKVRTEDVGFDINEILQRIQKSRPAVTHPAVITHPVTGAQMLYVSHGFTVGVQGLGTDEGQALLDEVLAFVEQPCFVHEFQWAPGDIILWDNRFFAHKAGRLAAGDDPHVAEAAIEEDTLVYRIIIRDGHALSGQAAA